MAEPIMMQGSKFTTAMAVVAPRKNQQSTAILAVPF
jgi:hypothetical protein